MTIRFVVSVAALVGLTACGGGGGNLGGGTTFSGLNADYDALQNSANQVANLFATNPLPTGASSNVGFEGVMLLAEDLDPAGGGTSSTGYLGKATLLVDFDGGTVDGSAGDFFVVNLDTNTGDPTSSVTAISGSFAEFDANAIVMPGASFTTPMTGTINSLALTGTGSGIFLGPNAALVQIIDAVDGDVKLGGVDHNMLIRAD
jgi:hypothetical protein